MFLFPSSFFFLFFMVLGVFISLSSSSIFLIWCGLEMNLMGFIPLMIQMKNLGEIEAAVKYFLVQSFGSALILLGGVLYFYKVALFVPSSYPLIFSGLFVKLGVFPFYFWLPSVMISLDWISCTLIATWQKVAPFGVLMTLTYDGSFKLVWLGALSSMVGGVLGMNQVNIKSLLAYSSIGHMGWMIGISQYSVGICLIYLFLYLISNFFIFMVLMKMNFYWMNTIKSINNLSSFYMVMLGLGFLTLAGIPPLLGFFPKLLGIEVLLNNGHCTSTFVLIWGTCFSLYYYITLVLNSCSNSHYWNWNKHILKLNFNSLNFGMVFLILLNLLGMALFLIVL